MLTCEYCLTTEKTKYTVLSWNGCDILVCKKCYLKLLDKNYIVKRGREMATRRVHNPKIVGSNPTPATIFVK
jgi:ribosome-binding protein aMBF1 (putative translation factor)